MKYWTYSSSNGSNRKMAPHSVFLARNPHGLYELVGCSPWGHFRSRSGPSKLIFITHFHALRRRRTTQCLCSRIPGTRALVEVTSLGRTVSQPRTEAGRRQQSSIGPGEPWCLLLEERFSHSH